MQGVVVVLNIGKLIKQHGSVTSIHMLHVFSQNHILAPFCHMLKLCQVIHCTAATNEIPCFFDKSFLFIKSAEVAVLQQLVKELPAVKVLLTHSFKKHLPFCSLEQS